jgi:NAD(P)H-hydrate epimerase
MNPGEPPLRLSREAVRSVDRIAINDDRIPGILLMENAASALCAKSLELLQGQNNPTAIIIAGPGNNAGDGFALARKLHNARVKPAVLRTAPREKYAGDAALNLDIIERMNLTIAEADPRDPAASLDALVEQLGAPALIIDAILGTGLDRPLRPPLDALVMRINELRRSLPDARTLAVDVPTGLDSDTGLPLGPPEHCIVADATVTFVACKLGFPSAHAQPYTGDVTVGDIGAPRELIERLAHKT